MAASAGEEDAPNMKKLYTPKSEPMRLACFMSGVGTNVIKIIERQHALGDKSPFKVVAVFSDVKDPEKSNAEKIAREYGIEYFCRDIADYYRERKAERKDMKVRRSYDAETREFLEKQNVDAVALCGYNSLITEEIFGSYPTLNVHPADLRKKDSAGKRMYAGYNGAATIRAAIANLEEAVASTVHLVTEKVDGGPIILISRPLEIDISKEERINPAMVKAISENYLDDLKKAGDWVIFPKAIEMLAEGRLAIEDDTIYIDGERYDDGCQLG
ncbi:hypothetical protein JXB11_00910 [Candidatus Woesearchaeota archaeon]|nr:hypothetical protein [Candidatus Woesearchaeota archaeon]